LQGALEAVQSGVDFLGHQVWVDVVQTLDDLQQAVVPRLSNGFVHFGFVLLVCLPCDSGRLAGRELRKELMFPEESREGEEIVGVVRSRGEVTGRCWEDSNALKQEVACCIARSTT
jgi:hypothetical protein